MLRSKDQLVGLQRTPKEGLGLGVVTLFIQQYRQVVQAGERVGMLRPQHSLAALQGATEQRFGLRIGTVVQKEGAKLEGQ